MTFTPIKVVDICICGHDFALGNSLFGATKLTKYDDPDKYSYSGWGIGFDARRNFLLCNGSGFGKNV